MSQDVWKELERMRLHLTDNIYIQRPLLEKMIDQHKAVVAEHDALAAHVERQAKVIFDTLAAIEDGDPDAIPYDEARAVRNEAPVAPLARLKAKTLDTVVEHLDKEGHIEWENRAFGDGLLSAAIQVRAMAEEQRRQAEELTDE